MDPLVSVIIPTHSGQNVIKRAVNSVINQSYSNIEIIVVDDNGKGSNNQIETEKALYEFINTKKIKYIKHEICKNGSAARNTGINFSKGEYVSFLDDDDYFLEDNIENHIKIQRAHDNSFGLSYCGMKLISQNIKKNIIQEYEGEILKDFLLGKIRVGSSLIVVRKNILKEINGFDESFFRHQDWELLVRILSKYKIASTKKIGIVKINLNRHCAKNANKFRDNRIYFLEKLKFYIDNLENSKEIYNFHYYQISKEYFKTFDIVNFLKYFYGINNKSYYAFKLIKEIFYYLKNRYIKF